MEDLVLHSLHESRVTADECPELKKVGIYWVGFTRVYGSHLRMSTEEDQKYTHIQITVTGNALALVDNVWVKLPSNTAYVMPCGAKWAWRYSSDSNERWNVVYVRLLPEFNLALLKGRREAFILRDRIPSDLVWAFQRLYREQLLKSRPAVSSLLSQMLAYFSREILDEGTHINQLPELWVRVSSDLSYPWTLERLSAIARMSEEKLRQYCRKETGRSPMGQVTFLRMRRAMEMIEQSIYNMQEIGVQVGYENPFSFSRAFKHFYGKSPTSFVKRNVLCKRKSMSASDQLDKVSEVDSHKDGDPKNGDGGAEE